MHVSPPRPAARRTLTSLPVELLTRISLLLDRPTALSLARVARALTFSADNRIWRDIDLFLPTHFGEVPLTQPYDRYHVNHAAWAQAEARKAEDRRRAGLRAKALQIAKQGSERRLGMVEKVHIVPRPEALHAILGFLELVASNLRELVIDPPAPHVLSAGWRPGNFDTLDTKILDYRLDFPSLAHLTITRDAIRFPEFITLLFRAAPNITHADIDVQHATEVPKWDDTVIAKYPGRYGELEITKLRKLRLLFWDRDDQGSAARNPVVDLVYRSPELEQVSLKFRFSDRPLLALILRKLSAAKHLRDLHISVGPAMFCNNAPKDGFPSLRRLILQSNDELEFLRSLHFESTYNATFSPPPTPCFPEYVTSTTVFPDLASGISGSPNLLIINRVPATVHSSHSDIFSQLDALEASGKVTGLVRSLRFGDEELTHARLYLRHHEQSDTLASETMNYIPGSVAVRYYTKKRVLRQKIFAPCAAGEGVWHDFLEYTGCAVPLEVVTQMRRAQGASEKEWEGRGVQVGARAWKILVRWRNAQPDAGPRLPVRNGREVVEVD